MNGDAMVVLDKVPDLTVSQRLVMMLYCRYANRRRIAWPSLQSLAKVADMHPRSMQRIVYQLVDKGLLVPGPGAGGGKGQSRRYYLRLPPPVLVGRDGEPASIMMTDSELELWRSGVDPHKETSPTKGRKGDDTCAVGRNLPDAELPLGDGHTCAPESPNLRRRAQGRINEESVEESEGRESGRRKGFDPSLGVDSEIASSWQIHRKRVKAPMSPRAWTLLNRHLHEIKNQGGDPNDALDLAMDRGWRTVEPEWYARARKPQAQPQTYGRRQPEPIDRAEWEDRYQARLQEMRDHGIAV